MEVHISHLGTDRAQIEAGWSSPATAAGDQKTCLTSAFVERTTGFEPATLTLAR